MEFRPCIDIHNGRVKQIVGSSLRDQGDRASENFVSEKDAAYYATLYRDAGIKGGHVILLNGGDSPYYEATREQAFGALGAYRGGLQIGGGVNADNAASFLEAGASHVIVTSYVFGGGRIHFDKLEKLKSAVGKEHVVLDLSCRKKGGAYYIVTDRWQNWTDEKVDGVLLEKLSDYCDEFLIHAVDVEGKAGGIETELVSLLGAYEGNPVTYAGGVHSYEDLQLIKKLGNNRLNVTIGSALDLFGGTLDWKKVNEICKSSLD